MPLIAAWSGTSKDAGQPEIAVGTGCFGLAKVELRKFAEKKLNKQS